MNEFPKSIHDNLKFYVYLYIDPRNDEIFYVGKGKGNRAFSHLSAVSENDKVDRINDIRKDKLEPIIEVLIHGIESEKMAKKIEASVIDLVGMDKLTNIQRGYESREFGRKSLEQLVSLYQSEEADITEPAILININQTFHYGISAIELYDATRSAWTLSPNREKAKYALSIYRGIIQEVYEIKGWLPNNSTLNTRKDEPEDKNEERWEFVGRIADAKIRNKYLYKSVASQMHQQFPIKYFNIRDL